MVRLSSLPVAAGILAHLFSALLASQPLVAQQQFPYVAYVVHADAYVRSGPGQRYYPTGQLPQGFAVEVYRHDTDGWCAVRPPQDSFSWVAAHEVRLVENNQAEVIAEKAVTRVGSSLSPARSAVQVLLQRGERVAVVPRKPTDDPNWLRVQPPAGEFRWIAAKDLGRQAPLEVTSPQPTAGKWSRVKLPGQAVKEQTPSVPASKQVPSSPFGHLTENVSGQVSPTPFQPAQVANVDSGHVDIVAGSPAELQLAQFHRQSQAGAPTGQAVQPNSATVQPSATNVPATAESVPRIRFGSGPTVESASPSVDRQDRAIELQLRLSQIVSQPPATWQFDQIAAEANTLLQETDSATARAEMRDLLDRIARFRRIRAGHAQVAAAAVPTAATVPTATLTGGVTPVDSTTTEEQFPVPELGAPVSPMAELVQGVRDRVQQDLLDGEESGPSGIDESRFDAVGLLKPVVSRRNNAPQYALVDQRGDVVSFVTPTPDLNLKPYVGRRVGVNGTRGFMNEYRRAHVTAGRITQVDDVIRR